MKTIAKENTIAKAKNSYPKTQTPLPLPCSAQSRVDRIMALHKTIGNHTIDKMVQAMHVKGTITPNIQRLCPECEEESARTKHVNTQLMEPEEEEVEMKSTIRRQREEEEEEQSCTGIQEKLTVGSPDDVYEQEADKVAEQVASFSNSGNLNTIQQTLISRLVVSKILGLADGPVEKISQTHTNWAGLLRITLKENKPTQETGTVSASIERSILQSKGKGSPLPTMIQNIMTLQTGYDFSNVRVKTDSEATDLNRSLNARAFAHGSDIWLGKNENVNDVRLMAHELTHVIQQGAAKKISPKSLPGLEGIESKSEVVSHLQAMAKGTHYDSSLYLKEITQFQKENSAEKIAALQRQILERSEGGNIQQQSDSKIMRECSCTPSSRRSSGATLKRTVSDSPTNLTCGGFTMAAIFSVDNADASTNGYVVQKVRFNLNREKCTGGRNDLQKTYWEAWQVRRGVVYIGTSGSRHDSDGFGDRFTVPPAPDSKGNTYLEGKAKFIEGYTEPSTWGTIPEAGSLPATTSMPAGWSDSGTLHRYIGNRNFDCCNASDLGDFYHQK